MSDKGKAAFGITATVAAVAATVAFWFSSSGALLASGLPGACIALGRLSGLVLALAVMAQFTLASRAPLLDALPGPAPLRIHRIIGLSIPAAIAAHVAFLSFGHALRDGISPLRQFVLFVSYRDGVLLALIAVGIFCVVVVLALLRERARLRYEAWYLIHLSVYAAAVLAFFHQIRNGDMAYGLARIFWITLALAVAALFLTYRALRPLYYLARHRFSVSRVVRETESAVSVYLTGRRIQDFHFAAGQYAHFTFLQRSFSSHHPFSFSLPSGGDELRITVKALGDFTQNIERLRPGTAVLIDGPMGRFTARRARTGRFCFIAGGIGITPIAALLRSLARPADAVLLVSNKTRSDTPLVSELEETGATVHSYFPESGGATIDAAEVLRACPDIRARDVYICGPRGMMDSLSRGLIALGVPSAQIHTEGFSY